MLSDSQRMNGFTLLELLVLLAMLGILLGISAVASAQWRSTTQLNNFLAELAYDINVTRTSTLSTGQIRRVRLVNTRQYVIEQLGPTNTWVSLKTQTAFKDLLLLSAASAVNFEFSTRGSVEARTQTDQITTNTGIKASIAGQPRQINVTALGIARRE
ncbi:prepilin-type N-terminal cleavage/methylation domain-containing protein [Deinococcus sp. QL22]|uniref:prepilin-type N-terminal cleavage/methylation domain-containing protein n=1 Tax=Deinococcus sp. QL22 TaxID=2939437 RepID=UPI002017A3EE|nr:prepilin-type N-terminal cleavage/methylation domain-containing protein [Deinococcus sp. QL22]UQN09989.1 prepilin-type N-terminal cleavage/methylation domain-containing protein [Deinococcus sp. QL22]